MLEMSVKVSPELGRIAAQLASASRQAASVLDKNVGFHAEQVKAKAQDKVPVRTGNLHRDINVMRIAPLHWMIHTGNNPYAAAQEFNESFNHFRDLSQPTVGRLSRASGASKKKFLRKTAKLGIKTFQRNPNAQWGYMRKSLAEEEEPFVKDFEATVLQLVRLRV